MELVLAPVSAQQSDAAQPPALRGRALPHKSEGRVLPVHPFTLFPSLESPTLMVR
jgi:hypothetical protein|eukprot:COSAG01_NODE_2932_length_6829_cov_29.991976_3_plen_55_part_00